MFVNQPEIPVPLVVEFPFPAWATRPSEQAGNLARSTARPTPSKTSKSLPGTVPAPTYDRER